MTSPHDATHGEPAPDADSTSSGTGLQPRRRVEFLIIVVVVLVSLGIYALTGTTDIEASDQAAPTSAAVTAPPITSTTEPTVAPTETVPASTAPSTSPPVPSIPSAAPSSSAPSSSAPPSAAPSSAVPLPSKVGWVEMSGKRDRTAGAKECRTEQRTVFVALEDYAAQADIVPGNPDVLVGSGHLPAHPTSWSARWAFAAIGDATYVVPVQGGACDR